MHWPSRPPRAWRWRNKQWSTKKNMRGQPWRYPLSLEVSRRDKGEPSKCRSHDRKLLIKKNACFNPVNACRDSISRKWAKPWPCAKQPIPAKVHPEEGIQQQINSPHCGCNRNRHSPEILATCTGVSSRSLLFIGSRENFVNGLTKWFCDSVGSLGSGDRRRGKRRRQKE